MKVAIGSDEIAFEFKEIIKNYVLDLGHDVDDYGVYNENPVLYPDIAIKVAPVIADGKYERGILICGTGIGMVIAANKVPNIRAAVCHDPYSTERARKSNNAQIMALGSRIIGIELAKSLVSTWLDSEFEGGRSKIKVDKISEYERVFREK